MSYTEPILSLIIYKLGIIVILTLNKMKFIILIFARLSYLTL